MFEFKVIRKSFDDANGPVPTQCKPKAIVSLVSYEWLKKTVTF